jgi:predicted dehydrogenase
MRKNNRMSNKEAIGVGVIGVGNWGKNLVRNFAELPGSQLLMCCDKDKSKLASVKARYGAVELTSEPEKLFANPDIRAVVVASTASTHFEFASRALESGKSVFVEKPLCTSAADAQTLCEMAEESRLTLMVGHLLLYHPAVVKLKEIVDSGELGELLYIYSQRVNLGRVRSDENALSSLGAHDISVMHYLFAETPYEVSATGTSYIQKDIEDVVFVALRFSTNRMGHMHLSWLDPHKERKITVVGSEKMAVFDDMQPVEKIKIYDKSAKLSEQFVSYAEAVTLTQGDIHIPHLKMTEPLSVECIHFLDCVRTGKKPLTDGRNGLEVVKVLGACETSLRNGGDSMEVGA